MLEETGLPYEAHRVSFDTQDQFSAGFLSLSPNNKIPAILDPQGPGGRPLALFESGAILVYLADKTGQLLPRDPAARYEALQWLMFQMGGVGPMFGQLGFFHKFAGKDIEDKRPLERYAAESARLLDVLDRHLKGRAWMMGAGPLRQLAGPVARHPGVPFLSRPACLRRAAGGAAWAAGAGRAVISSRIGRLPASRFRHQLSFE